MGDHVTNRKLDKRSRAVFIKDLLDDLKALEIMLEQGLIEDDIVRIGSEQEFCLVNKNWRPSKRSIEILEAIDDPHFTTELARFDLEINQDPAELKDDCFNKVEEQLRELLNKANDIAAQQNTKILLTGILPTISMNELKFEYMTPNPRYWALNDTMRELRGSDFDLHLKGVDELTVSHNSVLFEACNTSFQTHLQIPSYDFTSSYNWAQAIAGPILSVCTNSPLLLGRELWHETRIALFRQSIDTRSSTFALKDQQARVTFGEGWAEGSVADIFKNEVAEFKVILSKDIEQNSLEQLEKGQIPKLSALSLHNGTIYRWNRACYGVGNGKPHVRIENRYLPAGPTVIDEMANFAFWVGIMKARPAEYDDISKHMHFKDAKSNFIKAARTGKESVLFWMGKFYSARDLVLDILLPMAEEGLSKMNIDKSDIRKYLGVIESRTKSHTGSQWMVRNYRQLKKKFKTDDALTIITRAIHQNQMTNTPVHEWNDIHLSEERKDPATHIGQIMSTSLYTVDENDLAELAAAIMRWKDIHHLPVENKKGELCGLLTWTHMKKVHVDHGSDPNAIVSDIMVKDVYTVKEDTKIVDAIKLMKEKEIGCLPVIQNDHLIGIVTIADLIDLNNDADTK
ncbi:MAG: CBS domain-containing protein [Flavobacteriales bacterium]|nr:CBS domain-containing protein [Flavobacteriales bacterium]